MKSPENKKNFTYDDLVEMFQKENWKFDAHPEDQVILIPVSMRYGILRSMVHWLEEQKLIQVIMNYTFLVEADRNQEVAEAITRINFGLLMGSFELSTELNRLRFRIYHLVHDNDMTPGQLKEYINFSIGIAEHYFLAFQDIIFRGKSVEQALNDLV